MTIEAPARIQTQSNVPDLFSIVGNACQPWASDDARQR
jgi:hypothetical protein